MEDGRRSFSAIAKEANLTDVAIKKRFESLKKRGIIQDVTANLNLKILGYENPIYLHIRSEISKNKDITKKLKEIEHVTEVYNVLGEYNILAKIIIQNLENAEKIINEIGTIDGIQEIKSSVILSETKKTNNLPTQALQKKF